MSSRTERIRRLDGRPQHGDCWSRPPELTGEQHPGSEQIVKSDRKAQTKEIGRRSVLVLAGKFVVDTQTPWAKPSEIWLLIPNRNFDDPRFARFQRLSASIGRYLFISDQSSLTVTSGLVELNLAIQPLLTARTSGKRFTSPMKRASKGEVLSRLHARVSRRGTFKSTTGNMATVSGHRHRALPRTHPTPRPIDTRLRIVASFNPS